MLTFFLLFLSFSALCHWGKILQLRNYLPIDDAVGVDARQSEHEDGGGDEDAVKAGQPDQDAVDRVLHLGPDNISFFEWAVSRDCLAFLSFEHTWALD